MTGGRNVIFIAKRKDLYSKMINITCFWPDGTARPIYFKILLGSCAKMDQAHIAFYIVNRQNYWR